MTETKALAIAHYERMIAWAKKQPFLLASDDILMENSLGENWQGAHCSYCNNEVRNGVRDCDLCILNKSSHWSCCNGLWRELNAAKSWGEWVFAAETVLQFIRDKG